MILNIAFRKNEISKEFRSCFVKFDRINAIE